MQLACDLASVICAKWVEMAASGLLLDLAHVAPYADSEKPDSRECQDFLESFRARDSKKPSNDFFVTDFLIM